MEVGVEVIVMADEAWSIQVTVGPRDLYGPIRLGVPVVENMASHPVALVVRTSRALLKINHYFFVWQSLFLCGCIILVIKTFTVTGRCGQFCRAQASCVGNIESLVPSQIHPMTYIIYTCNFLAMRLALIGYDQD